jgi:hypothetical protein
MSKQPPEQLIARMLQLLDDADDSDVTIIGVVNFAKPEFCFSWWEDGHAERRTIRRGRDDDDVWRVTR